jgi:hypothetical protein
MTSTTRLIAALTLLTALCVSAHAQPSYSVDFQGPTSPPLAQFEGAVLVPSASGPPTVAITPGSLGLLPLLPYAEVDALSFGTDELIAPGVPMLYDFSVDEFAVGDPSVPGPSVRTEGAVGNLQASADIYTSLRVALSAPTATGTHVGTYDGNGTSFSSPTLNLVEPNPPTYGFGPSPVLLDAGDNLDAWDNSAPQFPVYFSMDSAFADPIEGVPANTGTAQAQGSPPGFVGGDVVVTTAPGGPPTLYAAATDLGLDTAGADTDDLDALILWENGTPGYQQVIGPFSWIGAAGRDQLLFSVRRGSAIIGQLDAITGSPISEGDILVPVLTTAGTMFPGIFINAEALGLGTLRNGTPGGHVGNLWNDDLDALDVRAVPEPGSLALLSIGASALLRRRRHHAAPHLGE